MPNPFDVDFSSANRAAVAAERDGFGLAFVIEVSDARWGRGLDISDPDVVAACANACGWNAQAARDAQGDTTIDDILAQHRSLIIQDGVFGVPFAVLERTNGTESFWGHDRFELFAESARED
jgi:2-hydroxychromene-2-carboxylate isomerase